MHTDSASGVKYAIIIEPSDHNFLKGAPNVGDMVSGQKTFRYILNYFSLRRRRNNYFWASSQ